MRGKALTVITAFFLSGLLISCGNQEQMVENQQAPTQKKSAISEPAKPAEPVKPAEPPGAPVLKEFAQEIASASKIEKMGAEKVYEITVSVKNIGTETWPAETTGNPVRLSYHWIDSNGNGIIWDGERTSLPNNLDPGMSVNLKAKVKAPKQPGLYTLKFTMVQENVSWFEFKGAKTLDIPVTVTKRSSSVQH